ncbi:MAG TPA: hypothetical protein VKK79_25925 [Candidatus Lokiarchaeia archaeon]|nr:hypothetical protein [Candidatus Lokiarchaeia archaeon]
MVSKDEIKEYARLKVISQLAPVAEKIRQFERKYGMTFAQFEEDATTGEENFEKWDDLIEWTGYDKVVHKLEKKIKEIDDAQDIEIVD